MKCQSSCPWVNLLMVFQFQILRVLVCHSGLSCGFLLFSFPPAFIYLGPSALKLPDIFPWCCLVCVYAQSQNGVFWKLFMLAQMTPAPPPHSIKHSGKQIKQKNPQEQQKPKKQNPKTKQLTNPNYTVPTVGKIHLWGWISSVASFKHSETG